MAPEEVGQAPRIAFSNGSALSGTVGSMGPPSREDVEKGEVTTEERTAFLSSAPRSGELSPFAQKVAAEVFVWIASIVVFGATIDFPLRNDLNRTPLNNFAIATSVISFIISSSIVAGQCLALTDRVGRSGWFSDASEKKSMMFLAFWWTIGAACLSALEPHPILKTLPVPHTSGIGIMFGWLALFASIFGAYKAYHAEKEEQRSLHYAQAMSMQAAEDEEFANFS